MQFDGVDDYVSVSSTSALNFGTNNFTVCAVVKPKTNMILKTTSDKIFVSKGNAEFGDAYPGWKIGFDKWWGLTFICGNGTAEAHVSTNKNLLTNTVFITGVRDEKNLYLYIDGTLVGSTPNNGYNISSNVPLTIGSTYTFKPDLFSNSDIHNVMIYNRALSQQEITQNYLAGKNNP